MLPQNEAGPVLPFRRAVVLLSRDSRRAARDGGAPGGKDGVMGIGISIFLIAIGALLSFAVTAEVSGVNLDTVGVVLMVAGAIGLVWALIAAASIGPARRREERVVERP